MPSNSEAPYDELAAFSAAPPGPPASADRPADATFPADVARVIQAFLSQGHQAYVIGPAAREWAINHTLETATRCDIITGAGPADINRILGDLADGGLSVARESRSRRSIRFRLVKGETERVLNVSPYRTFLPAIPSFQNTGLSALLRDLASREITLHAIAVDPEGTVLDPFGGLDDLAQQRIRTIAPPRELFRDSGLWLLRVARHVAYYGFTPDAALKEASAEAAGSILDVSPELWRSELERMLLHSHPDVALQYLLDCRVLHYLLPEVAALEGFDETCDVHHKDIWEHTCKVVQKVKPDEALRWAALFHDIGKVATRTIDADGTVHFFRHEELGTVLFDGIASRLRFDDGLRSRVSFLVRNHSRVNLYNEEWTTSAVRRLIRDAGEHLDDLLNFSRADITSRRENRVEQVKRALAELQERVEAVRAADAREPSLPTGIGHLIMNRFSLAPGPEVGKMRRRLEDAVESGVLERGLPVEDYLAYLATPALEVPAALATAAAPIVDDLSE